MIGSVDLSPAHRAIVERILKEHVQQCEVRAFGSRVAWTAKDFSDLDLAVVDEGPLPWQVLSRLKEAFEESPLPMRVDVLDWHAISESFRKVIERDYVVVQDRAAQTTAGEWRTALWGELATLEYGKSLRGYKSSKGPYRVYGTNGPIGWHSEAIFYRPSVIIGRKGAYRGVHYSPDPFFVIDTAFYLKPKLKLDTRWAYYQLLTQDINGMDSGSAIPSTSREDFYGLPVQIPPLSEQRAIAHVLGTLDDKIELNRRMNRTLEEMARALFKSWFVDFDPVRAKAALKQHAVGHHSPLAGDPGGDSDAPSAFPYHSPLEAEASGNFNDRSVFRYHSALEGEASGNFNDRSAFRYHSPLEGESARRGALAPSSRWGETQRTESTWEEIQRSYSKKTLEQAKALRQRQTDAEGLLWHYLRKKQLGGYKFRRQQPIGPYIADFACMPEKLLVELDGGQHAERAAQDERRDAFLRSKGFRVLRFWNNEVFENCFGVLERVYEALPNPPPRQPEPAGSTAATPPQGGSDGTPSPDSTPSPLGSTPSPSKGEGWGGGDPSKAEGEGGGAPAPAGEWTVERARAYLANMDPQIADLFPDRLVDSELGEIPEGWELAALGEDFRITMGQSPPGKTYNQMGDGVPLYQGRTDFGFRFPGYRVYCSAPTRLGKPGDTLVSVRAPVGDVNMALEECCIGRGVAAVRHRSGSKSYTYYAMRALRSRFELFEADGTVFGAVNKATFHSMPWVSPIEQLVAKFDELCSPLDGHIETNELEVASLAAQRDALLPKLMTGALRVREIVL